MELMGHRGASGLAPENTLAAFRLCLEYHPEWIELDVHESADGEVIVMHDATVERTTDGRGAITELTLAQIRALDAGSWKGAQYAGERAPTLGEVAALVGETARLNVEIKGGKEPMEFVGKVLDVLRDAGCLPCSMISSFQVAAVKAAQALSDEPALALISGKAEDLRIVLQEGFGWLNLHYSEVTPDLIKRAQSRSIDVCAWTVNDLERWEEFRRLGVSVLCTDMAHLAPPLGSR